MGWETNVITQIVFNKETYDSIYKVEEEIDFCNRRIQEIGNKLMIYSTSRPEDILLNKKEDTIENIQEDVRDMIYLLQEYFVKRYALEVLKNNFKCVDGDYIDNPDRKKNIKNWLIDNYILDKEDINENVDNIENKKLNNYE